MDTTPPPRASETLQPALRFDWRDWLPYFEGEDIPEEQKRALIETLWSIVVAFVDLGWQVREGESCGQALDLKAALEAAVLRSNGADDGKEGA